MVHFIRTRVDSTNHHVLSLTKLSNFSRVMFDYIRQRYNNYFSNAFSILFLCVTPNNRCCIANFHTYIYIYIYSYIRISFITYVGSRTLWLVRLMFGWHDNTYHILVSSKIVPIFISFGSDKELITSKQYLNRYCLPLFFQTRGLRLIILDKRCRLVPIASGKKCHIRPYVPCVGILAKNKEIKIFIDHLWYFSTRTIFSLIWSFRALKVHESAYTLQREIRQSKQIIEYLMCLFNSKVHLISLLVIWFCGMFRCYIASIWYIRTYSGSFILKLKNHWDSIYHTLHLSKTNSGIVWNYFLHTYYIYS